MKKIFFALCVISQIAFGSGFTPLEQVDDYTWVSSKGRSNYIMTRGEGIVNKWETFVLGVEKSLSPELKGGCIGFRETVCHFRFPPFNKNVELWVAYITQESHRKQTLKSSDIRMFVATTVTKGSAFFSNMGISKTNEGYKDHSSLDLQHFTVKLMAHLHPEIVYMVTTPTPLMRGIFLERMLPGTVFIGDNLYENRISKDSRDWALWNQNPGRIRWKPRDGKCVFILTDAEGGIVAEIDTRDPDYFWFFRHDTHMATGYVQHTNPHITIDIKGLPLR